MDDHQTDGEIEITPMPGTRVEPGEAAAVIDAFRQKYRIHTKGRPAIIPTWCTFPVESATFLRYETLYFFHEFRQDLYSASPHQIRDYFLKRNPWEDPDLYILDSDLGWCITFTHEDEVIIAGDYAHFV